jgi:hypothetical protein
MWVKMLFGLKEICQYRKWALLDSESATQSVLREWWFRNTRGK